MQATLAEMGRPTLRYDRMVTMALRGVVREVLALTADHGGLPGDHHFYITFRTDRPDVDMPDFLREKYSPEITIVLEHRFSDLKVELDRFSVTLSFNGRPQRLTVPFSAITAFADPSVKFSLEFPIEPLQPAAAASASRTPMVELNPTPPGPAEPEKLGEVVKLDAFRKKSSDGA
jgi:uncharacterized protein